MAISTVWRICDASSLYRITIRYATSGNTSQQSTKINQSLLPVGYCFHKLLQMSFSSHSSLSGTKVEVSKVDDNLLEWCHTQWSNFTMDEILTVSIYLKDRRKEKPQKHSMTSKKIKDASISTVASAVLVGSVVLVDFSFTCVTAISKFWILYLLIIYKSHTDHTYIQTQIKN